MNNANGRTQDLSEASPDHPTQDQSNSSKELREQVHIELLKLTARIQHATMRSVHGEDSDDDLDRYVTHALDEILKGCTHHQAAIAEQALLEAIFLLDDEASKQIISDRIKALHQSKQEKTE